MKSNFEEEALHKLYGLVSFRTMLNFMINSSGKVY